MSGNAPVLAGKNLTRRFSRRASFGRTETFTAVDDVSLELHSGETLALVGESGSGKSTTARMLAQLITPSDGTVELGGRQYAGRRLGEFRRQVQVVFQDPFSSLNPRHRVEQIISAPMRYLDLPKPAGGWTARVKELMERVGLNPDHSQRFPSQFSGGQAQRIGIARAIAVEPSVVICDEAVSALDVSVQARVLELLRELQQQDHYSYLFITHDLAVVREIAHRIAVMSQGKIVETGDRQQIFTNPQQEYTRTLLAAVPQIKYQRAAAAGQAAPETGRT
ncbi:ATP-binding cassette domain-containing protein [Nakamurella aerolata]|uniref:ABC transporter ATP-binding protein n=1 Tax=Nakamurella aerolata TaxID=1656892 RepID=A0A849AD55_9ACTN|nr:ATP-binding cassette domain-containing protein [Nakamurella aerolata]NNG34802.1 ABC transporter ATP-binding protein [Nakamurella aerolata]